MSLRPPEKVRKLQRTLHAKAKESPDYRFYAVYDKVYREDVLHWAYRCCKANGGAAGVDGETFEDNESYGRERWLGELSEAVRSKSYRAAPIRRVYIPKGDGRQRPLGIPTTCPLYSVSESACTGLPDQGQVSLIQSSMSRARFISKPPYVQHERTISLSPGIRSVNGQSATREGISMGGRGRMVRKSGTSDVSFGSFPIPAR